MKTASKVVIIILVLLCLDLILKSCHKAQTFHYTYNQLDVRCVDEKGSIWRFINEENDTVSNNSYRFHCSLMTERIGELRNDDDGFLIANAQAFKVFDFHVTDSRLGHVSIITVNQFNSDYPAGSDLTDACVFSIAKDFTDSTVEDLVSEFNNNVNQMNTQKESAPPFGTFTFKILPSPATIGPHKFRITTELEDGNIFTDTTLQVYIKP